MTTPNFTPINLDLICTHRTDYIETVQFYVKFSFTKFVVVRGTYFLSISLDVSGVMAYIQTSQHNTPIMNVFHAFYYSKVETPNKNVCVKGTGVFSVTECTFFNQDILNNYCMSAKFKLI